MKPAIILLIPILILLSCNKEREIEPNGPFINYTTANSKLPTNFLTHLAIGKNGVIWIGTFDHGLVKFDGKHWTTFNVANSDLPSDSILSLAVDKNNKVWIGTTNGLASLDFKSWKVYNTTNSGLKARNILSLSIDSSGKIWAGGTSDTLHSGLYCFDGSSWQYYNQRNSILPNDVVTAIATAKDNTLLIGTGIWMGKGGFLKFKNGIWKLFNMDNSSIKYNMVDNISVSSQGNILLSSPALLFTRPNILEGYMQELSPSESWRDLLPYNPSLHLSNRVTASTYDQDHSIWLATAPDAECPTCDYALIQYDGQTWRNYSNETPNFPRTFISEIKADKDNNIWIASGDVGLIKILKQ